MTMKIMPLSFILALSVVVCSATQASAAETKAGLVKEATGSSSGPADSDVTTDGKPGGGGFSPRHLTDQVAAIQAGSGGGVRGFGGAEDTTRLRAELDRAISRYCSEN
jgi:hypothetical protein